MRSHDVQSIATVDEANVGDPTPGSGGPKIRFNRVVAPIGGPDKSPVPMDGTSGRALDQETVPALLLLDFEVNASPQKVIGDLINWSRLEVFLEFRTIEHTDPCFGSQASKLRLEHTHLYS